LLEPVLPALLRHDMMMLRDGVAMGCGRQESRGCQELLAKLGSSSAPR
jgi:hypothetical protein